jgi:predicted NBD/HSP70 family sugar kinase
LQSPVGVQGQSPCGKSPQVKVMTIYAGFDIGGTKFMAAAADEQGTILRRCRRDTPAGLDEGLALLDEMAAEVMDAVWIAATLADVF